MRKNHRRKVNNKRANIRQALMKQKKAIITSAIIIFILMFFVIFSIINSGNERILNKISIDGIDVSNLTTEQAIEKIRNYYQENNSIKIQYKELEENIINETIIKNRDIQTGVQEAYKIGRAGNIVQNNFSILFRNLFKKNIEIKVEFNEEEIEKKIEEINSKLPGVIVQNSYYIEDGDLIIKRGSDGIQIKKEELKDIIKNTVLKHEKEIQIPVEEVKIGKIDIEKIHKEVYKEAQNASITEEPVKINPEINGIDFGITIQEAKKMLEEEKEEYTIPLKITIPQITVSDLGKTAFPDKLGEFTTRYDASFINRSTNLELAADKINGTIIMPGETFSYNKIVGERTISKGYKEAPIYSGGRVVDGIGGGICQLSSTLYNTVVYANLEVTSRTNHRFKPGYVEAGRDATVSWGTIDFCFKNNRQYPIKVVATVGGGVARVAIFGIKEEKEYDVTLQSIVTDTIPYTTNYINDSTMKKGEEVIEQNGSEGVKSITYKIVRYNGVLVSKTIVSTDTYSPLEKIIRRGTKAN